MRRGAVDLVGHQQLGEDRALDEAERARLAGRVLEHFRADDVGRHEVGRELDALGVEAQHLAQRLDQQRLGEAGDADQQRVAAGEDRDQRALDHDVLAEDDRGGGLVRALHALGCRLQAAATMFSSEGDMLLTLVIRRFSFEPMLRRTLIGSWPSGSARKG